jgi:DnaK suppressor protein
MRQEDLRILRQSLEDRRQEILAEAERAMDTMNGDRAHFADPADRAALESARNLVLRMRDRERKLLAKIAEAFARIENGTYGQCEECGLEIGFERLKARPVTTLCINCKANQEARERQR